MQNSPKTLSTLFLNLIRADTNQIHKAERLFSLSLANKEVLKW